MHGNVYEWVQDWYDDYTDADAIDPKGSKTGAERVIRGGGWDHSAQSARSAYRYWNHPGYRSGFFCHLAPHQIRGARFSWKNPAPASHH